MVKKQSVSTTAFVGVACRHNPGRQTLMPYLCLSDKIQPENGGQGSVLFIASVSYLGCLTIKYD